MPIEITVLIPGQPVAQGRAGRCLVRGRVLSYDPAKSRNWKGQARTEMLLHLTMGRLPRPLFGSGALEVQILAVFDNLKAERKRSGRRYKDTRPDLDNIEKACLDAGNSVLWTDDGQVARVVKEKVYGAPGESPFVLISVRELDELDQSLARSEGEREFQRRVLGEGLTPARTTGTVGG